MDSFLSAKPQSLDQAKGNTRRSFLKKSLAVSATLATVGSATLPRLSDAAEPLSQRYPDPLIHILDDSFLELRVFNASVEKLATGMRWAEGPVWVVMAAICWSATSPIIASCAGTKSPTPSPCTANTQTSPTACAGIAKGV